ncbi:transglycosylase domain-containing protein [Domibacillus epiphyticus]|uniref:Penicillin-binding protein n=1 Tax=Domibacillus epiphyticus TaxID=1714355 RepID=A0A1V2A9W0_9BACI|nr:transglycosylase domain-containing protein [Domibacillus epiphyticus]OMP67778.1 penicillin-binding protein [Domibacillus epiphyticus]
MRTVFGYMLIILLIPVSVLTFYYANAEAGKVQNFDDYVEQRVIIKEIDLPQASRVKDANGDTYLELHQPNRVVVEGEKVPAFLKEVFLQSEDKHFYEHAGIDAAAVMRALLVNAQSDEIEQGASTITQQVARNVYLTQDRTLARKISEVLYSYQLEKKLEKEEILNLYLNVIYFNHNVYGVESAAQYYFQKPVDKLSKAQMAFIAAIPNNPSLYDPEKRFDNTKKRQERLIDIMVREELITADEAEQIKNEKIILNTRDRIDKYPDYSTYVMDEFKDLIAESEGFDQQLINAEGDARIQIQEKLNARVSAILTSGVIIHTALDPVIQQKAVNAVNNVLAGSSVQGSAAVVGNQSHDIVALSGGKDFDKTQFNRAFQGYRQPGSTIKPLLDYAPYMETFGAGVNDLVSAGAYCTRSYCPKNYSKTEYGMVTLKEALAKSHNTAAIRLYMKTGIEKSFSYLDKFEFDRINEDDRFPAASLGGIDGFTTLEMAGAYSSFVDGTFTKPHAIKRVTDLQGNTLYEWKEEPVRIWSSATTYKMRDMLTNVVKNGTGKKANFAAPYIGGKTGTTNNVRDLWFVGLTEGYTAAVWTGKDKYENEYQGIRYMESYAPHQLIWRRIMQ